MSFITTKMSVFCFAFASCLSLNLLHADTATHPPRAKKEPLPWLTGPLLTPSANVVPNGHANIEPYEYVTTDFGRYNKNWTGKSASHNMYNVLTSNCIQIGMPANLDFSFTPAWQWNHTNGSSHWVLVDMPVGFQYQLLAWKRGQWWPSILLSAYTTLPIGKYQKLHQHDHGTDQGGMGSWDPSIQLSMSHMTHISGPIFFYPRWSIQYNVPTPVHVQGLNSYGGGHHTHGTAHPGNNLTALFGFELSLPSHWALAGDIQYQHYNKNRFSGRRGKTDGITNSVTAPSSESFSIAPAIEYNWSANVGIIAGAWFTIAGRNVSEFASGVIAVNVYH